MRKTFGYIVVDILQSGGMIRVGSGALEFMKNLEEILRELWVPVITSIGQYQLRKDGGISMERHGQVLKQKTLDFLIVLPLKVFFHESE